MDLSKDSFYIIAEGSVQQESHFSTEFISKVPLNDGQTEWNIRSELLQGPVSSLAPATWFGFEELAQTLSSQQSGSGLWSSSQNVPTSFRGRQATAH